MTYSSHLSNSKHPPAMMETMLRPLLLSALGTLVLTAGSEAAPRQVGDPELLEQLAPWMESAMVSTRNFGAWPDTPWELRLHPDDASFEATTAAPTARAAAWIGDTLHLRPWEKLRRRDLGPLLRHESAHRRLLDQNLTRWREEALCLWAEGHPRPPDPLPPDPAPAIQARLDLALAAGTTASQAWAYAWLRAWLAGSPLPQLPPVSATTSDPWEAVPSEAPVTVVWPPERLPRTLEVNGEELRWQAGAHYTFHGTIRFSPPAPVSALEGNCRLEGVSAGWRLSWTTTSETWIAAATEGELGAEAPFEAKRALAGVLKAWLGGPRHPNGTLCPLTHCAVVRGMPTAQAFEAVRTAPPWPIPPERARFTGSHGGAPMSPREVWGGPDDSVALPGPPIPEDPWNTWTRQVNPAQVKALKSSVRPGLKPGQRGIRLGASGPYAVESLRLEAGRRFGWTLWPSNACEATLLPDGSLHLLGHGWGHNVGLSLASAIHRARSGEKAEAILADTYPGGALDH